MLKLFWSREVTNVSHLEPILASQRERRARCLGRRCRTEREAEREGMGMGVVQYCTVQSLLQ